MFQQQRRVLSVREWARAQGFTDRTEFKSTTNSEADVSVPCAESHSYEFDTFLSVTVRLAMVVAPIHSGNVQR